MIFSIVKFYVVWKWAPFFWNITSVTNGLVRAIFIMEFLYIFFYCIFYQIYNITENRSKIYFDPEDTFYLIIEMFLAVIDAQ